MRASRPVFTARTAGVFYLFTFIAGFYALGGRGRGLADVVSTACYVIVTLLVYELFKPVNRRVSLVAATISLLGCAVGTAGTRHGAA